jgi:DnaJ-class molecular chaperone
MGTQTGYYQTPTIVCPLCGGLGALPLRPYARPCDLCRGTGMNVSGRQTQARLALSGQRMMPPPVTCPNCQGTGQMLMTSYEQCLMCQATGRIPA